MAALYPFSIRTAELLAQAASGVSRVLTADACAAFLRRCCELHVTHRQVPEWEIQAAVGFAYGRAVGSGQWAVG
jgi:hypothetical protein